MYISQRGTKYRLSQVRLIGLIRWTRRDFRSARGSNDDRRLPLSLPARRMEQDYLVSRRDNISRGKDV